MVKKFENFNELDPYGEEDWGDNRNIYIHLDRPRGYDLNFFVISVIKGEIHVNDAGNQILTPGGKLIYKLHDINNVGVKIFQHFDLKNIYSKGSCLKISSDTPKEDIEKMVNIIYDHLIKGRKEALEGRLEHVKKDIETLENKTNIKWRL